MPDPAEFLDLILVSGEDRITFLQGQLSYDLINAEGSVQLTAMCNPKGRIIALFYAICTKGAVYLVGRKALIAPAAQHLKRFVFRSKVDIEHHHNLKVYLSATINKSSIPPGSILESNGTGVRARLARPSQLELLLSDDMPDDGNPNSDTIWSRLLHFAGIPEITSEQSEQFLPEVLNLDLSGGVSFDKGCYTGQEVIARMHYLGNAKKRLFRITTTHQNRLKSGMPVFSEDGHKIGEIFSVSPNPESERDKNILLESIASTDQLGLAILTNDHISRDKSHKTNEDHQRWANQPPGHVDTIPVDTALPTY